MQFAMDFRLPAAESMVPDVLVVLEGSEEGVFPCCLSVMFPGELCGTAKWPCRKKPGFQS